MLAAITGTSLSLLPVWGEFAGEDSESCQSSGPTPLEGLTYQVIKSNTNCFVYVTPVDKRDLVFRSYVFSSDGAFQIFESYGRGSEQTRTGIRSYFFPSLRGNPHVNLVSIENQTLLQVASPSGIRFKFDPSKSRMSAIDGADFVEFDDVDPGHEGGIEIFGANRLWIDSGYARGHAPYEDLDSSSWVIDRNDKRCSILNRQLFVKNQREVKLLSPNELRRSISSLCPHLHVDF